MNRTFLNMKSFGLAILALAASAPLSAQSLQPSTTSITLQAPGSAAVEQTFSVTITGNTQNQPLQVVAAGGSWLTVAPQSLTGTQACVVAGTANTCTTPVGGVQINNPGASVTFRAVANPTAPQVLSPGTYTGQFTLQLAGTGVFASVSVNFTVGSTANTISVTTPGGTPVSQINFNAAPNQTTAAQSFNVTTTAASTSYTAQASYVGTATNWMTLTTSTSGQTVTGTAPGQISVVANATGLAANTYQGSITFTPTGGGAATVVNVTLVVSTTPQFNIARSQLSYTFVAGSGAPNPSDTFLVGVTTGPAVAYTITPSYNQGMGWLAISGTQTTGNNLTVTANPTGLTAGTYTANLLFQAAGFTNVTLPVTFSVLSSGSLTASPTTVSLFASPGSTVQQRSIQLTGSSGAAISYNATRAYSNPSSPSFDWLTVTGASGSTPNSLVLNINPGTLTAGTYQGNVTITPTTPGILAVTIPVTLTVTSQQIASASPASLSFNFTAGGSNPAAQTFTVNLSPTTTQQSFFVSGVPDTFGLTWLNAAAVGGISPANTVNGTATVSVTVNPAGLANGTYTGRVQINFLGAGVANTQLDIPVTLTVSGSTGGGGGGGGGTTGYSIVLNPTQLNFFGTPSGNIPLQALGLTASNGSAASFTLTPQTFVGGNWLTVGSTTGTTPTTTTVSVNTAGLLAGTYNAQITVNAPGATNNGVAIPVTMVLNPQVQLQPSPSGLTFTYNAGSGQFPSAQTVTVNSSTGAVLGISTAATTSGGGNWLQVSPGSTSTGGSLIVTINGTVLLGLTPGVYNGTVSINAGVGAANSPYSLPVRLEVLGTSSGGGTGSTQLVATPSAMNFFALSGSTISQQQILSLNSSTTTNVSYTISSGTTSGGNWLTVNSGSGTTPGQIVVTANPSGLSAGDYSGSITISSTGTANPTQIVQVLLRVNASAQLTALPGGNVFTFAQGGATPGAQAVTIGTTNNTAVPFSFTTSTSNGGNWLIASVNSNQTTASMLISVSPAGLAAGVYTGQVSVTSGSVVNSPLVIPVTLIVTGTGGGTGTGLSLNPAQLSFFAQTNGVAPATQAVQVTATGSNVSYTVSTNQTWLQAGPSTGTTPSTITVGVTPFGLAAGNYSGTVTITGVGGTSATLPVSFTVTNNPILQVNQQTVSFNYQTAGAIPPPRPILVSTSNGSNVAFSATVTPGTGGNWLNVQPTGGTTPGVFALQLVPSVVQGLAAGTYNATVSVTAAGTDNSPLTVNVTLTVSSSPLLQGNTAPITFNAQFSGNPPAAQTRTITSTSTSLGVSVSSSTTTGSGWLTAQLNQNTTPATLTVNANPFGLATGVYTGTVVLTAGTGTSTLTIPVTLNVSSQPLINVSVTELSFGAGSGGTGIQPQTVNVTSTGQVIGYSVSTNISGTSVPWLTVNTASGQTPGSITVSANPGQLPDGTYFGTVTISAVGIGNSPLVIPVVLVINNATALTVAPASLTFNQVQGSLPPAAQNVEVRSQVQTPFGFTTSTQSGGDWLAVTQVGGLTNGILQVSTRNTAALPVGAYRGTITVFGSNSPNTVAIDVTMNILPLGGLSANPTSLTFTGRTGGTNPTAQTIQIGSSVAGTQIPFAITTTTTSGTNWLTATPTQGTAPVAVQIGVNLAGLAGGTYQGEVRVAPGGAFVGAQTLVIPVTLTVEAVQAPAIVSIVNGASLQPGALAPGLIFSVFGTNMGPANGALFQLVGGRVPTSLSGVRVLMDNQPAPLLFARQDQINAIVPYGLAGRASVRVVVEYNNVSSQAIEFRMTDTAPAIFSIDPSTPGRGQAAVLNENGSVNGPANPEQRGRIGVLYATGEGALTPPGVDGDVTSGGNLRRPVGRVRVRVGGVEVPEADIFYAGSAPGLVVGVLQINFRYPMTAPAGTNVPIEVTVGNNSSQAGATVSLR